MPPRNHRARFAVPSSDDEAPNDQPVDTSGDDAMARRLQQEYNAQRDEERRLLQARRDQQRAALLEEELRLQEAANRRAAIRGAREGDMRPWEFDPEAARVRMMQNYGRHFEIGHLAAARQYVPGAGVPEPQYRLDPRMLAAMMQGGAGMGPDPRAVQEQNIRDSWAGINFVPRQNPLLGFTFDFDKDAEEAGEPTEIVRLDFDDDAPIIEELRAGGASGKAGGRNAAISVKDDDGLTSLVCASCHMPLRVSQGQRNEGDRVFALQCGHLVDKRCLDDISQPKPEYGIDEQERKPGFTKIGSSSTSRANGFVVNGEYSETPLASTSALPRIASPSSPSSPTIADSSPPLAEFATRRTRSAAKRAAPNPTDEDSESQEEIPDDADFPPMRGRKTRSKKRKAPLTRPKRGAAIKKLAKPEEKREYKWLCPVLACGREHYSEEVGGVWKPKEGMTVQLFV
jgi:hypothetical protein